MTLFYSDWSVIKKKTTKQKFTIRQTNVQMIQINTSFWYRISKKKSQNDDINENLNRIVKFSTIFVYYCIHCSFFDALLHMRSTMSFSCCVYIWWWRVKNTLIIKAKNQLFLTEISRSLEYLQFHKICAYTCV